MKVCWFKVSLVIQTFLIKKSAEKRTHVICDHFPSQKLNGFLNLVRKYTL